jgi:Ca2+/Na+ antiporter
MLTNKTKYLGFATFFLFVLCFVIDLIAIVSSFSAIDAASESEKGRIIMLLVVEIAFDALLIGSAIAGIYKMVKSNEVEAPFRRAADCVGCFGVYIAFAEFYAIYLIDQLAKEYNTTYKIPAVVIVLIVMTILVVILSSIASIKKIQASFAIKVMLLIGASLLALVVIIILLSQGQMKPLLIVEYIFLIITLLLNVGFAFFCLEDSKASAAPVQKEIPESELVDDEQKIE